MGIQQKPVSTQRFLRLGILQKTSLPFSISKSKMKKCNGTREPQFCSLIEGRLSALIQRHYLTVNDGFVWHGCESLRDAGIPDREVTIVTGAKLDLPAGFDGQSAVVIHL